MKEKEKMVMRMMRKVTMMRKVQRERSKKIKMKVVITGFYDSFFSLILSSRMLINRLFDCAEDNVDEVEEEEAAPLK
jgi:ABC-type microcin C transport system permease subunit YejB